MQHTIYVIKVINSFITCHLREVENHQVSMIPILIAFCKELHNKIEFETIVKVFTSGVGFPVAEHFNETAGPGCNVCSIKL